MGKFALLLLLVSPLAVAGDASFLDYVGAKLDSLHYVITEEVPGIFHRMTAWFVEVYALAVISMKLQAIEFAYLVAKQIMMDLNLSGALESALSFLPSSVKWALVELNILNALNIIMNAWLTRFVMNILGM
ncbi:DUF2523 family protein [Aeromonas schubertii]